jgi:hypothetical protein
MTDNHPITPPPELVQEWVTEVWHEGTPARLSLSDMHIATQAARWGADTELNECCKWLPNLPPWSADDLRKHRRPKPPSLKETLLARVARIPGEGADAAYLRHWVDNESQRLVDLLHKVFKSLPD